MANGDAPRSIEPDGVNGDASFTRSARQLVLGCAVIVVGLATAGSVDQTAGGVILVVGWVVGVHAMHRLGRSGPDRG
jgi:hypothetical protein